MIMIETSRLFLREMGPEDFDALYAVYRDHKASLSVTMKKMTKDICYVKMEKN